MARQGLRTKGGTGIWVWVLVAFGVFLVSAMASVDEPQNLRRADSTETTPEKVIQEAHMEIDDTGRVIAELRATIDRLTTEKNNLVGEHDQQLATITQLRGALMTAQVSQTGAENALQTELQSRQAEAAQTAARITQMQQDANALTERAQTLKEEKERLEDEYADMVTTLNARNQHIRQLEGQRIPQLETQIAQYMQQKDNAEAEVMKLRPKTRRLEMQVDALKRDKEEAERQMRSLGQRGRRNRSRSPQREEVRFGIRSEAADNKRRVVSGASGSVPLLQDQLERTRTRKLPNRN